MGRKVTTHAHGKGGIDAAVRAGYDSIEHGMWADEESLRLMKQHGTYLIPTVWPITWVGDTPEKVLRGPMKDRSEEHTSELQSLMRISYAVLCLKKKKKKSTSYKQTLQALDNTNN